MKILNIVILSIPIGIIGNYLYEYLHNRITCNRLKLIHRYQKILNIEDIMIRHRRKTFYIVVDYLIDDPIYKCKLYINEELCLTGIELNHGNTNSRQLEYNHKRSAREINKLLRLAYRKLKKLYYEKELKIDYSYTSFWED